MKNGDMPAMPGKFSEDVGGNVPVWHVASGLTKRELFAAMAMQGLLASPVYGPDPISFPETAPLAVAYADALIAELEKAHG